MTRDARWSRALVGARRSERDALLERARRFVEAIPLEVGVVAAVVFGSVARGDFNAWSDVDVLVIAENLPARPQDRFDVLLAGAPAGVQPVAWTRDELLTQARKGNPIVREALSVGVIIHGEEGFQNLLAVVTR